MAIFIDKNGFNLRITAERVLAHTGIMDDRLLFYYDCKADNQSGGRAMFCPSATILFKHAPYIRQKVRNEIKTAKCENVIYFDGVASKQSFRSNVENIAYHAHELHHYVQLHSFEDAWDKMDEFRCFYNRRTPRKLLTYETNPIEHDAMRNEKKVVLELVSPQNYKKYLSSGPISIKGIKTLRGILKDIDLSKEYDLKTEVLKLRERFKHIFHTEEDDPPMTSTDESNLDQLSDQLEDLEKRMRGGATSSKRLGQSS